MNLNKLPPITAVQSSLRAAVAAGAAAGIAKVLQFEYPIHALMGAVLVLELSPRRTRELAVQRLLGTLLGAGIGALLSYPLPSGPLAIGIGILTAMLLSYMLGIPGAAKVAGYVSGIVVMAYGSTPWLHAYRRTTETVLGIGMAVAVSFVPKLIGVNLPSDAEEK
jgi:uncharacterized membrane protein YgaE (UPF0421/DUF939 family)